MKKMIFLGLVSAFVDIRAMDESIAGQSQHSGASECPGQSRVFPQCTAMSETKLSGFKPQIRAVGSSIIFKNSSSDRCGCIAKPVSGEFVRGAARTLSGIVHRNLFRLGKYDQLQSQILTRIFSMPEAQQRMFLKSVDIPDNVEEICDSCFRDCKSLSSVTFGEGSNLKLIGKSAFMFSGLREIQIPDNVEELCDQCFFYCKSLSSVTFGENSSLKRIGERAFSKCGFRDINIPAAVQDLGDFCFSRCKNLIRVYFLDVTKLQHVGTCIFQGCNDDLELDSFYTCRISEQCFEEGGVRKFVGLTYGSPYFKDQFSQNGGESVCVYDDTIERLDDKCFMYYISLESITFGDESNLKFIGMYAFAGSGLKEIYIPDTVEEIGKRCFSTCESLVAVRFGEDSRLCKIGKRAFARCYNLEELNLPDGVESIPYECFYDCNQLDITFGRQSSLRYIGDAAFAEAEDREWTYPRTIYIPDGVEELGVQCFLYSGCTSIIFGENSALKMAGVDWCLTGANVVYPQRLRDVIRANLYYRSAGWGIPTFQTIEPINKIQVAFRYYDSDAQEQTISLELENETTLSLYNLDQETAMQVVAVTIPPNIEIIDYDCFFKCANLRKVTFADGSQLKLIRSGAFAEHVFAKGGLCEVCAPKNVQDLIQQFLVGTRLDGKVTFSDPQQAPNTNTDQQ